MGWARGDGPGEDALSVPAEVETWDGLRPYFAAMWARLLADLPSIDPPTEPPPRLMLCVDGRQGAGHVWLVLVGGGGLPAAVADPVRGVTEARRVRRPAVAQAGAAYRHSSYQVASVPSPSTS